MEKGDWGDVALKYTKLYGEIFAVLNMANARVAGGGYIEGKSAQEENMFRRTDCHFSITTEKSPRVSTKDGKEDYMFNQAENKYLKKEGMMSQGGDPQPFLMSCSP